MKLNSALLVILSVGSSTAFVGPSSKTRLAFGARFAIEESAPLSVQDVAKDSVPESALSPEVVIVKEPTLVAAEATQNMEVAESTSTPPPHVDTVNVVETVKKFEVPPSITESQVEVLNTPAAMVEPTKKGEGPPSIAESQVEVLNTPALTEVQAESPPALQTVGKVEPELVAVDTTSLKVENLNVAETIPAADTPPPSIAIQTEQLKLIDAPSIEKLDAEVVATTVISPGVETVTGATLNVDTSLNAVTEVVKATSPIEEIKPVTVSIPKEQPFSQPTIVTSASDSATASKAEAVNIASSKLPALFEVGDDVCGVDDGVNTGAQIIGGFDDFDLSASVGNLELLGVPLPVVALGFVGVAAVAFFSSEDSTLGINSFQDILESKAEGFSEGTERALSSFKTTASDGSEGFSIFENKAAAKPLGTTSGKVYGKSTDPPPFRKFVFLAGGAFLFLVMAMEANAGGLESFSSADASTVSTLLQ